jgi:hypothetical protein
MCKQVVDVDDDDDLYIAIKILRENRGEKAWCAVARWCLLAFFLTHLDGCAITAAAVFRAGSVGVKAWAILAANRTATTTMT